MIAFAMLISALRREVSKPAAERTWQGKVWRVVPDDFRPPTWARVRERMWAARQTGIDYSKRLRRWLDHQPGPPLRSPDIHRSARGRPTPLQWMTMIAYAVSFEHVAAALAHARPWLK